VTEIANTEQFDAWNGDSGRRWIVDPDRRDRVLAPVGDALLDASHLTSGERVLDIGCGCGATSLAAARSVGTAGAVLGGDLSAPMLDVARRRAEAAGLSNVAFVQADAQTHDFGAASFDVVLSRFGTMFFADPHAAFTNIARALGPGGRLCMATWQPLLANEWLIVPGAALLQFGSIPDGAGDGPGMFAQSDPDVITATLAHAGFAAVDVRPVSVTHTIGLDPAEAAAYLAESGPGRAVLETVAEADRSAALDAVRAVLADHLTPNGVQLGAAVWITTARCPS
jgi:ubiquinone/menaquinone biosynthesis C-methylase UbiE